MSNDQRESRDTVTASEEGAAELFDFGPDVERPADGPRAALPPWLEEERAPVGAAAEFVDLDRTPEPAVVPSFARSVPAPRRRRKPVPAELAVITAPAVVDGGQPVPAARPAPLRPVPVQPAPAPSVPSRVIVTPVAAPMAVDAPVAPAPVAGQPVPVPPAAAVPPAEPMAPQGPVADEPPARPRGRRRALLALQAVLVLGIGSAVGVYATGGVGFLDNRTRFSPPVNEASAWVLNNLSGTGTVLVPATMSDVLLQNGQDSDALTSYPESGDVSLAADCCDYVVVTGGPDAKTAEGLPAAVQGLVDRSRAAAEFRTDGGFAQIRQVLPGAAAKVAADLAAEREALIATGKTLLEANKVKLSDTAKVQLLTGQVDPRVLLSVVAVSLQHKLSIASFPADPGGDAPGILRRAVAYDKIDGEKVAKKSDEVREVKDVLGGQTGIYRPAGAEVRNLDGVDVLWVGFDAPSPFGLLTLK